MQAYLAVVSLRFQLQRLHHKQKLDVGSRYDVCNYQAANGHRLTDFFGFAGMNTRPHRRSLSDKIYSKQCIICN